MFYCFFFLSLWLQRKKKPWSMSLGRFAQPLFCVYFKLRQLHIRKLYFDNPLVYKYYITPVTSVEFHSGGFPFFWWNYLDKVGGQSEKIVLNVCHFTVDKCCFTKQSDNVAMPEARTPTYTPTHIHTHTHKATRAADYVHLWWGKCSSVSRMWRKWWITDFS